MTTHYMTADFRLRSHKRSAKVFLSNIYTVEVVDFDGESREYSVSAESFEEAAREAESTQHVTYIFSGGGVLYSLSPVEL